MGQKGIIMNNKTMKKIHIILLFAVLAAGVVLTGQRESKAAVKLSAKKVTFAKPEKGSKTITIKGVKKSNIKKLTVTPSNDMIVKATKKGKNKFVLKARYAGDTTVSVNIEYKKPVKGYYSFYGTVNVKVKGTSKIPIKTVKDLTSMMDYNDKWVYVLKNDLDLSGVKLPLKNKWGENLSLSNTTLDGDGHTIKNLNGPFLCSLGGTLKNIKFVNFKIDCKNTDKTELRDAISKGGAAALIQYTSVATIKNCSVQGSIKLTFVGDDNFDSESYGQIHYLQYVGGLVGRNQSHATIENCVSDVDITLDWRESTDASKNPCVGGICGENGGSEYYTNNIKSCANTGDIITYSAGCFLGGITGYSIYGNYENCLNTGSIYNHDPYTGEKEDINWYYGGLVGWETGHSTWKNSLNSGNVGCGIGGNVSPTQALFTENKIAFENVYNEEYKTVKLFHYYDPVEIAGVHNVSGADMTSQASFGDFDFAKVWTMTAEGPRLKNVY